ncbi:hypothetical protein QFZ79_003753 [Arthrobacter sp. V4I6]|uniref:hypothetical protein n=1 Tax=unclassified Arthrobacter TaxID=235627 RepID=UPI002784E705|nr:MULTISPECIES: hypothetical protein [unclassified Arthrobacter]MDQ0821378.1 hypothetical protein [Arthrobacter sp. V1I7]MDQ0855642.1 hypothetical protein [Arthrobacter sp. V4I6]
MMPHAVPHIQVFPVTVGYEAETGLPLQVMLQIYDGKLEHLAIDTVAETEEAVEDLLDRWPNPDEVQYVAADYRRSGSVSETSVVAVPQALRGEPPAFDQFAQVVLRSCPAKPTDQLHLSLHERGHPVRVVDQGPDLIRLQLRRFRRRHLDHAGH